MSKSKRKRLDRRLKTGKIKSKAEKRKGSITPSAVVGMGLGLFLIGLGLYRGTFHGEPGAFYVALLGACVVGLIVFIMKGFKG